MCWEFVRAKGRTGLPVWPWRPDSRSAAAVKAARSAPRSGLALTAERSKGLGGLGGLPPIKALRPRERSELLLGGLGGTPTEKLSTGALCARVFSFKYLLKIF